VRCRTGTHCVQSTVWPLAHEAMIFGILVSQFDLNRLC
jgi:hypothetical protein